MGTPEKKQLNDAPPPWWIKSINWGQSLLIYSIQFSLHIMESVILVGKTLFLPPPERNNHQD